MNRITDLEKFALQHIVRPYQDTGGFGTWGEHIKTLPVSLESLCDMLSLKNEWSRLVLGRISKIGFTFPKYIKHPLVDIIKSVL